MLGLWDVNFSLLNWALTGTTTNQILMELEEKLRGKEKGKADLIRVFYREGSHKYWRKNNARGSDHGNRREVYK
jgi:hypothetical protein